MELELVQASIAIAAAYWGYHFVTRQPNGTPWFGVILFAVALACGLGVVGRHADNDVLGGIGAIGLGAGVCMLIVGPLLRTTARRLAIRESYGVAARLLDLADILAPGSGANEEKALLGAMREIREGRIEQTVEALTAAKHGAPADARLAIDERITMLYLAAYRWDEGIRHAEEFLWTALAKDAGDAGAAANHANALRRALGLAPPVWVELLGAYARTGDLDRAAGMLAKLEDACALREDATSAMWIHRARMIFLALAGRVGAVEALTTARAARHLSSSARTYWRAVALENHGDRAAATTAYERARRGSRGMPRELIDKALARLVDGVAPVELGVEATRVVARVEAAPPPAVSKLVVGNRMAATWTLTALVCGVAFVVDLGFGSTTDYGVLLRGGAMISAQIRDGEWWRLVSCVLLHIGVVHLVLNAVSLFFLARFAEQIFGTARTFAIFALAGLGGSVASYAMGPGPSAGASGAVFGLLAASFVEITVFRHRYAALRPIWSMLAVIGISELGYGFFYKQVDQWAHGGGLVAGAIAGIVLSPYVPWRRAGLWLGRAIAVAAGVLVIVTAVMIARTSAADSLAAGPAKAWVINGVTVDAPASWAINDGELYDGAVYIVLAFQREPAVSDGASGGDGGVGAAVQRELIGEDVRIKSRHFDEVATPESSLIPLPSGWKGTELEASVTEDLEERSVFRVVIAAKQFGGTVVVATMFMPEWLARVAPQFFSDILGSAR